MALTIYDIARRANVSITTVSRVLNNKGDVSENTKRRIQQILDESGYSPSQLARGLASKSSKTVGIMAVDIRDVHHSTIVYQSERVLSMSGYSSIVCNLGGRKERLGEYLSMLTSRQVEGLIFVGSVFADEHCVRQIEDEGVSVPSIIINAVIDYPHFYSVLNDEDIAYPNAVDFLVQKNRSHIALIYDDDTISERRKRRGYRAGMLRNGLGDHIVEVPCPPEMEGAQAATGRFMLEHPHTDAIIYTKDLIAAGGIHALCDLGRRIPEEVAVVGINNSIYARICRPQLTSIDNQPKHQGQAAAKLLVKALEGDPPKEPYLIPCTLTERQST